MSGVHQAPTGKNNHRGRRDKSLSRELDFNSRWKCDGCLCLGCGVIQCFIFVKKKKKVITVIRVQKFVFFCGVGGKKTKRSAGNGIHLKTSMSKRPIGTIQNRK